MPSYLFYVEDREALLVGDTRAVARRVVHRLQGAARVLFLFCDQIRPRHAIARTLIDAGYHLEDGELTGMLAGLVEDRLLVEDKERYLGLAVRAGRGYLPPIAVMTRVLTEERRVGLAESSIGRSRLFASYSHAPLGDSHED